MGSSWACVPGALSQVTSQGPSWVPQDEEEPRRCLWLLWVSSAARRGERSNTRFPKLSYKLARDPRRKRLLRISVVKHFSLPFFPLNGSLPGTSLPIEESHLQVATASSLAVFYSRGSCYSRIPSRCRPLTGSVSVERFLPGSLKNVSYLNVQG